MHQVPFCSRRHSDWFDQREGPERVVWVDGGVGLAEIALLPRRNGTISGSGTFIAVCFMVSWGSVSGMGKLLMLRSSDGSIAIISGSS